MEVNGIKLTWLLSKCRKLAVIDVNKLIKKIKIHVQFIIIGSIYCKLFLHMYFVRSDYFYGTVKAAHFAILTARSARAHKQ